MIIPPSTVVLEPGQHMQFREAVERLFQKEGCVARMNIYCKKNEETVYIEFHPVAETPANTVLVQKLLADHLDVDNFVMRPQLLFS